MFLSSLSRHVWLLQVAQSLRWLRASVRGGLWEISWLDTTAGQSILSRPRMTFSGTWRICPSRNGTANSESRPWRSVYLLIAFIPLMGFIHLCMALGICVNLCGFSAEKCKGTTPVSVQFQSREKLIIKDAEIVCLNRRAGNDWIHRLPWPYQQMVRILSLSRSHCLSHFCRICLAFVLRFSNVSLVSSVLFCVFRSSLLILGHLCSLIQLPAGWRDGGCVCGERCGRAGGWTAGEDCRLPCRWRSRWCCEVQLLRRGARV